MKISVDENICIGCGTCESLCPECFVVESGISKVKNSEGCSDCDPEKVAESCPVNAIKVKKE